MSDGLDAGVLEAPEVDSPEVDDGAGLEVSAQDATGVEESDEGEGLTQEPEAESSPFTTKFSREYRQWLNGQKADPLNAKFVKQAKDDYGRIFAIQQLEPKGIDGIREKYALLDSLAMGDAKGADAITAMQESLREAEEVDSYILNGDPKAFESMGKEFDAGLSKLAGPFLERVQQANPEAFAAAITPHVIGQLQSTPVLEQFNYLVDVLNGKYGRLDDQTKMERVYDAIKQMGDGFNALGQKAAQYKQAPVDAQKSEFEEQRATFEKQQQDHHWKSNIQSQTDPHANNKFEELFKPYNLRLKLGKDAASDLRGAWIQGVTQAMNADPNYVRQIKLFRGQKNPDPTAVTNFVKNAINKHAKSVLDSKVTARYGSFLSGKPRTAVNTAKPGTKPGAPPSPGWEVRTVMPAKEDVDWTRTTREHVWNNQRILKSGKRVQGPKQ